MKKTLLTIAVIATIGLSGYQFADAQPGGGYGYGMGPGYMMGQGYGPQVNEQTTKAQEKFFNDTKDLRKQLYTKRVELNAVLTSEHPDESKVAKLSGELFDLREAINQKATESGLTGRGYGGYFCNGPWGGGHGHGMMGYGPGAF